MSTEDRDRAGRFRPGAASPNPHGRPKRLSGVDGAITQALAEKVTVTEQGRRRRKSKLEIAAAQIANKSASGDLAATKIALDQSRKAEERAATAVQRGTILTATDRQIIAEIIARIRRITPQGGGNDDVDA